MVLQRPFCACGSPILFAAGPFDRNTLSPPCGQQIVILP
ncbi:hypothetical protein Z949_2521 [Sulfitobacter guttiformis KCTC 32187]|nr:hypothetical protein Z949_2521 [Sulfitobacter guttiformis KCTC 32187]